MAKWSENRYPWTLEPSVTMNEPSLALCAEVLSQGEPLGLHELLDTLRGHASGELYEQSRFATAFYLTGDGIGSDEEEVTADLQAALQPFIPCAHGLPMSSRCG